MDDILKLFHEIASNFNTDIFYLAAILIYILIFGTVVISTIIHQKHIEFYRVFMRKDMKPSKLALTWICVLPICLYQAMTGDHEISSGLLELLIAVFIAELAVQGIDLAGFRFGRCAINKINEEDKAETESKTKSE